jgi:HEAT repeat protein
MFLCAAGRDYNRYQDYLVEQAREGKEEDRLIAMQVLGYIGDARVVPPLVEIFYDSAQSDKVRQSAIWDLGHTPVPEAARALVEMVNSSKVDWFYKEIVIASIRRLSADKKMAPVVTGLLEKSLGLPVTGGSPPPAARGGKKGK